MKVKTSAPKNKIHSRPIEFRVRCKKVSRRAKGKKLKLFLKVFRSDVDFSGPIVGVEAGVVSSDYQVCKELINELRVINVIMYDKINERGGNK